MGHNKHFVKVSLLLCIAFFFSSKKIIAQYAPLFHQSTAQHSWYADSNYAHSTLQPIYVTDSSQKENSTRKYWLTQKLFDEHLFHVQHSDYTLRFDFLPDIWVGQDISANVNTRSNGRGFRFAGDVQKKFTFDVQVYEQQTITPDYIDSINNQYPNYFVGQGWTNYIPDKKVFDYTYAFGHIAYKTKYFHFQLGNEKLFIGDGYRSLMLSDVSAPFPFFRATFENKRIQYSALYMQHLDPFAPKLSNDLGNRKKWSVMHFLSWNMTKKFTLGFFDSVTWQDDDSTGKRGFEMAYANPIIFLRPVEYSFGSSDNAVVGINLKYQITNRTKVYGQFVLDEFKVDELIAGDGWWANKFAWQVGIKGTDIFHIKNLNGFAEFNYVKPYTYSHWTSLKSYTNTYDGLAHPLGANFIETVTRLEYGIDRWQFFAQLNLSQYGLDSANGSTNVGKNILLGYNTRDKEYDNKILQGIPGALLFSDLRVSYMLNPKLNMRIELGYVYREEKVDANIQRNHIWSIGWRSSFRNLYFDR